MIDKDIEIEKNKDKMIDKEREIEKDKERERWR